MSSFFQIFIISFSLALDCFSVSICAGISASKSKLGNALKVAVFFGVFQAVMPIVGWAIGQTMKGFILSVDHWIAFVLLGFIGIKMIKESFEKEKSINILQTKTLIMLSLATSIDALIVGLTLSLFDAPLIFTAGMIGIVAFILSLAGFLFGKQIGVLFGKKIEMAGGVVLVLIGTKILLTHLFF